MSGDAEAVSRQLLHEEIGRIVDDAKTLGETLRTGPHAARLAMAYPDAHFSIGRIVDEFAAFCVCRRGDGRANHNERAVGPYFNPSDDPRKTQ